MAKRTVLRGLDPLDRFFHRVEITETCWLWRGASTPSGYGMFTIRYPHGTSAHRYAYEAFVGPIPEGLEIDHLCRVRQCVNPDHMEPVTKAENMRRAQCPSGSEHWQGAKTHCPQGHPYDDANTYHSSGRRYCLTCRNARNRARSAA